MTDENSRDALSAGQSRGHLARPIVYEPRLMSDIKPVTQIENPVAPITEPAKIALPAPELKQRKPIPDKEVQQAKKFLKHNKITFTLSGLALIAFIAGVSIGVTNLWFNNQTKTHVAALSQKATTDVPSEGKPSATDLANYTVAPDLPRLLIIPKINVKSRVTQLGVKADDSLMAPDNIYDTGWYTGSAKPGQSGAVVIDGHVHGPTKPGVFTDLKDLLPGDKIQIERGDHKIINYLVVKAKTYDVGSVDMAAVMTSVSAGKNGLNLITCTGSIDVAAASYNQRLVVFAVQQS